MDHRFLTGALIVACLAWQAYAAVNCTSTGAGRFSDDDTCQNYTLCVYVEGNSSYVSYNYVCPTTALFDSDTQLCTADYTCNTTSSSNSTSDAFSCTSAGRFANDDDTTCKTYFLCVLSGSTYVQYNYTCTSTAVFNPTTKKCTSSSSYTCTS